MEKRILTTAELAATLGCSRSHIYISLLLDPTFPKPFKLGVKKNAWLKTDIENWIKARASEVQS